MKVESWCRVGDAMSTEAEREAQERHKRIAAQILNQLPEDKTEALAVLAITHALLDWDVMEALPTPIFRIVAGSTAP
jgi:putative heme iron utilization protein